jgi:hypothetical protein
MKVSVRKPEHQGKKTLLNQSGIGLITLTNDEQVVKAELLTVKQERITFNYVKHD